MLKNEEGITMTVQELQELLKGEDVIILDGKGKICIDFEFNNFLAILVDDEGNKNNDFLLNVHETLEEAIEEIRDWKED
jgi:hypothetical protein